MESAVLSFVHAANRISLFWLLPEQDSVYWILHEIMLVMQQCIHSSDVAAENQRFPIGCNENEMSISLIYVTSSSQ